MTGQISRSERAQRIWEGLQDTVEPSKTNFNDNAELVQLFL